MLGTGPLLLQTAISSALLIDFYFLDMHEDVAATSVLPLEPRALRMGPSALRKIPTRANASSNQGGIPRLQ